MKTREQAAPVVQRRQRSHAAGELDVQVQLRADAIAQAWQRLVEAGGQRDHAGAVVEREREGALQFAAQRLDLRRQQGLIVATGNPLALASVHDLARPGLRFANGPRGSGTRVVLEELLAGARIAPADVTGFEPGERSHLAAAEAVASGSADAAFGTLPTAQAKGLDFLPLAEEQYFLVTLAAHLDHPHVRSLLAALQSPDWRAALDAIPGHAAERCGEVLALSQVLPWWNYRKPKSRGRPERGAVRGE